MTRRDEGLARLRDEGLARLREEWAARADAAGGGDAAGCPPAAAVWDAAHGRGTAAARGAVADHTVSCASCALAWRIAADLAGTLDAAERREPAAIVAARHAAPWLALAAAALLAVAGASVVLWRGPHGPGPIFRGDAAPAISSLVAIDAPLSRDAARLAWTPGPQGALYDVRVSTEDLVVVARAVALRSPEYTIPAAALAALPAGTRLLWQVDVVLADGRHVASDTFAVRLR